MAGDSLIHECTSATALTGLHNLIVQASERAACVDTEVLICRNPVAKPDATRQIFRRRRRRQESRDAARLDG